MTVLKFAVLTVSDRSYKGERADLSGPGLVNAIRQEGWEVVETGLVPDEKEIISQQLMRWCKNPTIQVILTTGGTGFAPRDVTPEATRLILEREAPGISEAMRQQSLKITPHAMLSRGVAGIKGKTIIINLPGSPRAAVENLGFITQVLPHAVALLLEQPEAESGHEG